MICLASIFVLYNAAMIPKCLLNVDQKLSLHSITVKKIGLILVMKSLSCLCEGVKKPCDGCIRHLASAHQRKLHARSAVVARARSDAIHSRNRPIYCPGQSSSSYMNHYPRPPYFSGPKANNHLIQGKESGENGDQNEVLL